MSEHIVPVRIYIAIFLALIVLTATTTAVAFVDLGIFNTFVALGIAMLKASLVILFFMHVRYSSNLVKVFAGAGFVGLIILIVLLMSDYLSRDWAGLPLGWN